MKFNLKKGDRDLEREVKKQSGYQCNVKMSGSEKNVNENTYDIFSKKCVTKKVLEASHCSRAKQWQRNIPKKYVKEIYQSWVNITQG